MPAYDFHQGFADWEPLSVELEDVLPLQEYRKAKQNRQAQDVVFMVGCGIGDTRASSSRKSCRSQDYPSLRQPATLRFQNFLRSCEK